MDTTPHGTPHAHPHEHGVGHVVSPKILIATCIALLVLTVLTVAVALIDFAAYNIHELNIIVALTVAFIKAALVCLFFMHLYWDRPFNSFVLLMSLAFVVLFMGFAMIDVGEYKGSFLPGEPRGVIERIEAAKPPPPPAPVTAPAAGPPEAP